DSILQQVRPARRSLVEQRERVTGLRVLAEDDDTDVAVRLAEPLGSLDSFVSASGRHPDVRHDDVGPLTRDGGQKRLQITANGDNLELRPALEQPPNTLADEVVIL